MTRQANYDAFPTSLPQCLKGLTTPRRCAPDPAEDPAGGPPPAHLRARCRHVFRDRQTLSAMLTTNSATKHAAQIPVMTYQTTSQVAVMR